MRLKDDFWTEGPGSFGIAIGIALFIRWALLEAYVIPSGSMLPTLLIHDHIFVNKTVYGLRVPFTENWMVEFANPERGEVIVFKYPEEPSIFYIKRVVGVPGDQIFYENGNLYINEKLIDTRVPGEETASDFDWLRDSHFVGDGPGATNNYLHKEQTLGEYNFSTLIKKGEYFNRSYGPYVVPEGNYFVMGDNRDNSKDSRFWHKSKTFVPRALLVGRASFVWLSCEEMLSDQVFLLSSICNPLTIRWKRFGHTVH